ncbi:hypothetical protein [Mangrovimonas cancribranchiae]|uniref:Glycine dehydrogenase n=1 Tax=Mangrovimonas cancribranchiae TaxID=3080055 RepID=A0AAU6P317_9FLAO
MKQKKSFLFISCDEAKHICDKAQYKEASILEKMKLNVRYLWCRVTRSYVKRNKKLTHSIKGSNINCLNNSEKKHLQKQFKQELKKQQ